jgi:hypothetical protein
MKGRLSDKLRIQHILDTISEIENYLVNQHSKLFLLIKKRDLQESTTSSSNTTAYSYFIN